VKAFGGRKRVIPAELDLTKVERAPGSRAHIRTVATPDSAATPDPSRPRRTAAGPVVTSLGMALPLLAWLAVCLTMDAPAFFTLATSGGVLLLTAVSLILCRPAPRPRAGDKDA
jgi:hypothetical protein